MKKSMLLALVALLYTSITFANNVKLQNISIINNGGGDIKVKFDVSWDNSWRVNTGQDNYDGVWVFFKARAKGSTGPWYHISTTGTANIIPSGAAVYQAPYGTGSNTSSGGAVIYRAAVGAGSVSYTNIQLSVNPGLPYNIDVQGFAVEMVYIPRASTLYLGDGNNTTESTNAFHGATDNQYVGFNGAIQLPVKTDVNGFDDDYLEGQNSKSLNLVSGWVSYNGATSDASNPNWPTLQPVWCMKYEITNGAYRDFLNSLTLQQQAGRTLASPLAAAGTYALKPTGNSHRSVIKIKTPGTGTVPAVYGCDDNNNGVFDETDGAGSHTDGEYIACTYLTWPDLAAWLSWAGLAPMTEVTYERICRGTTSAGGNAAIYGEYAWGTNEIMTTPYTLSGAGTANETITNPSLSATIGNAAYSATAPVGVLRNGIFAAHPQADRVISGAGFFGVMELSGNTQEICVTLGNAAGRNFGINAPRMISDGYVSPAGNADYATWPGSGSNPAVATNSGEIIYSAGTVLRGGHWNAPASQLRISDRSQGQAAADRSNPALLSQQGGRGVLYVY